MAEVELRQRGRNEAEHVPGEEERRLDALRRQREDDDRDE